MLITFPTTSQAFKKETIKWIIPQLSPIGCAINAFVWKLGTFYPPSFEDGGVLPDTYLDLTSI